MEPTHDRKHIRSVLMSVPDAAAIRDVFRRNSFCTIATASLIGEPWLSPVFYNYAPDYTVVWESAHDALHSQYLRANPRVAIFIKDVTTRGPATDLYIEALAQEVPPNGLSKALSVWQDGPHGHSDRARREPGDYGASRPLRLYEARIQHLYVISETVIDDYRVDTRVEIALADLTEGAKRQGQ
jgi:hypothetical protein